MALIAGIDEAGRGPVIGPMVMAIVACSDEEALGRMGVADSKLLAPQVRERLDAQLRGQFDYELIALAPEEIDRAVNGKSSGDNLNRLEARTAALLISRLAARVPISTVIIDSPTRTTATYERDVREALARLSPALRVRIVCEIKADANHKVVGAASIIAKVARDAAIRELEATHGPLGSGYPSDPATQAFLSKNWRAGHEFFRKSWESYRRLAEGRTQASLADFGSRNKDVAAFEALLAHGFRHQEPTNQYEVVRMRNDYGVTVIKYTTGKLLVQGPAKEKAETEALIAKLKL